MYKKMVVASLLTAVLVVISVPLIFSMQDRLTTHKSYCGIQGDGGSKIYFKKHESGENLDLYRMEADGTNVEQLTGDSLVEAVYDFFPDKSRIAVVKKDNDYDYIYVINSDGSNAASIYSTTLSIKEIKVSPDGQKIAFVAVDPLSESGYGTLYLINADGSGIRMLSNDISSKPAVLADDIGIFDITGSTFTKENVSRTVSFSSDSVRIAFISSGSRVKRINIDGTDFFEVSTAIAVLGPHWLSSGKILFGEQAFASPDYKIATINPDGTGYSALYTTSSFISGFAVSPDEAKFAINAGGKYAVIISSVGVMLNEIPVITYNLSGISWVSDTKLALYSITDIFVVSYNEANLNNITNNQNPVPYLMDAKDDKILFAADKLTIYTMNCSGTGKTQVMNLSNAQSLGNAYLSPDGVKILYSITDSGVSNKYKLCVINSDASQSEVVIEENNISSYYYYEWSRAGTKILYVSTDSVNYMINPDGSGKTRLIPVGDSGGYFKFSPDDTQIIFEGSLASWDYAGGIYKAPVDLSTYTLAVPLSGYETMQILDWNSNIILYSFDSMDIYTVNSDGSNLTTVANNCSYETVKLSPDGTRAAYKSFADGKWYHSNVDGSGKLEFTGCEFAYFGWSPDSSRFCYTYSPRRYSDISRIYLSNSDGTDTYNLNPSVQYCASSIYFAKDNRIVYYADYAIWSGDYVGVPEDMLVPEEQGEVKVVVPEGAGERGTINPDSGKPVAIGFKGSREGKYTLRIFTQLGEKIYEDTIDATSSEGWFSWIPGDIASGVYLVHIKGPGVNKFQKIAILR